MNDLIGLEKIAQWQRLKTLLTDSASPITKRVHKMALDDLWPGLVRNRGQVRLPVIAN